MRAFVGFAMAIGLFAAPSLAWAADPVSAQQAPVKGSDVLGDKGRTGPDGWSWAPQTRDQAPADRNNQTANNGRGAPNSQPDPNQGRRLAPGNDPGTPAPTDAHGPGTTDTGAAPKP